MKRLISALILIVLVLNASAQLKIVQFGKTADLNGATIDVSGQPTDVELAYYIETINQSSSSLELKVIRTEVDALSGTENATCWKICPAEVAAGTSPVLVSAFSETIAPNDTNNTFAAHYYPNNLDGCSYMKYEWVDAQNTTTVYATLYIRFIHSTNVCTLGVDDINKNMIYSVYPNPASDFVNVSFDGFDRSTGNYSLSLIDMLGQQVSLTRISDLDQRYSLSTASLTEGVYFVTLKQGSEILRTQKLLIKR